MTRNEKTLSAMFGLFERRSAENPNEYVGWRDVMDAVEEAVSVPAGGWMAVRNVLQFLMDQGAVERDQVGNDSYRLVRKG